MSVATAALAQEAPRFVSDRIPTLGGKITRMAAVRDINNHGVAVGTSLLKGNGEYRAFTWVSGDEPPVALPPLEGQTHSSGWSINDSGVVGGYSADQVSMTGTIWSADGQPTAVGTLGGAFSYVNAISEAGDAAGGSTTADGELHPYFWKHDTQTMIDLGLPPDFVIGEAWGINSHEPLQIVGMLLGSNGRTAFVWTEAGGYQFPGTFGGLESTACAVNDLGQVVGGATTPDGNEVAYIWDADNGMVSLGVLDEMTDSTATAINNTGQVVGRCWNRDTQEVEMFLWDDGKMYVLERLLGGCDSWRLIAALGVNDDMSVVGTGDNAGIRTMYCMTAVPPDAMRLAGPAPGDAYRQSRFCVDGAEPNSPLYLIGGWSEGQATLPVCNGLSVDMAFPCWYWRARADRFGDARWTIAIGSMNGRILRFQAASPRTCTLSNLRIHRFE
ncbi:MAG: hypothetical protein HND57_11530 [Planctomycetes bacterium]|nr:hypothetical protein [Planctomycetota bacterium]